MTLIRPTSSFGECTACVQIPGKGLEHSLAAPPLCPCPPAPCPPAVPMPSQGKARCERQCMRAMHAMRAMRCRNQEFFMEEEADERYDTESEPEDAFDADFLESEEEEEEEGAAEDEARAREPK
jgi:hypothetical protein